MLSPNRRRLGGFVFAVAMFPASARRANGGPFIRRTSTNAEGAPKSGGDR